MRIRLHRIGNSQGVIIPKPILAQAGLSGEIEMTVENNAVVLRMPKRSVRAGWAEDSKAIAASGDDELVWPEFGNADDRDLTW